MTIPIAVVRGEPLNETPHDLYIPPDALEVFLETFTGPLDLLLYLIRRDDLDVLDIPIAAVTRQYIAYIEMMSEMRMELAAEYLLMAAFLAEIKSRMLLPRPNAGVAPEEDPRADLMRRLLEYERFKQAAEDIDRLPRLERDVFSVGAEHDLIGVRRRYPELHLDEVLRAFRDVIRRAEQFGHHHIQREPLSVRERMSQILQRLGQTGTLAFPQLFRRDEGRHGAVVSLLAVLELGREGLIDILQDEALAELRVQPRGA
ncbi:MAG TPA: ScpA family protein [Methylococcaceae bacterium]|nr:ScpA family protein [Methylococcaceae bacterium]